MRSRSILPAGLAVAAMVLADGGPALAGGLACGETLAPGTVTTLTQDLECPSGPFVLTVDAATLNLNGFSITCLNPFNQTRGVVLTGKSASISGPGSIVGCDPAVVANGEGKHAIDSVHIDSEAGVTVVLFSDKNVVTNSITTGEGGIRIFGDKNTVTDNQVFTTVDGVNIFGSRNRVTLNQLTGNEAAINVRAEKNKVSENTLTDPGSGVTIEGAGHLVSDNLLTSAELYGIRVTGSARILENTIAGSGGIGIDVSSPADAKVKISENDVGASGDTDLRDATSDCGEHKWSRNLFDTASPESCIQ